VAEFDETPHRAEMHEGLKSQFDVIVDGRTMFSKQRSGRFPYPGEVSALLAPG
jgi:hypothetical protein